MGGREQQKFQDEKVVVPETLLRTLQLYHDSAESGGHDGLWRTYNKFLQRFRWDNMKADAWKDVQLCHLCQLHKVKYRQRSNKMTLSENYRILFWIVRPDFTEISNKGERRAKTLSFVVGANQCTGVVPARLGI